MTNAVVRARIGRLRVTRAVTDPSAAAGIRSMRAQMKDLQGIMKRLIDEVKATSQVALKRGMQPVFDLSQRYVPVDTGALKKSGYLETGRGPAGPFVEIGYGRGGRPHYTLKVHESLEFHHKPPTQAKFLQAAIEQEANKVGPRIGGHISKEIFE